LIRMHREWGIDAVFYGRLAASRPYGDPALGLELALVDARDGATLWSAQDVVDARDGAVRTALLAFQRAETGDAKAQPVPPSQMASDSFARFVARSFVRTLFTAPAPPAPQKPASEMAARARSDASGSESPAR